jgi:chemotaxis protein methyltransferase CheR
METVKFDYIRKMVYERAAIVLEPGKEYLVQARLGPLARKEGLASVESLVGRLQSLPWSPLHLQVVEALTTNETSFFRDLTPFHTLRHKVLPELITRHAASRKLRIWSAACSSGQEIYSIAMILREHFPELGSWNIQLLATDYSTEMVQRCKSGVFTQLEVNRGLPAPMLVKYFKRNGTEWQIRDDLRQMVDCRHMNLTTTWSGVGDVDVVFMRNVLIYFDVDTKKRVLGRLAQALRPKGTLFLGAAETTLGLDTTLQTQEYERGMYYRNPG